METKPYLPNIVETLAPADAAAAAEAVRGAGATGLGVFPVGGGTMLAYGATPKQQCIALSIAEMHRVVDYPAADMTITVDAGITIAELKRHLADQRQRLPVDVPHAACATIGGAIAVHAAGPRRYGFGTLRDYLLGFTAIDGHGTVFSGGGRVVKNTAGYNMPRLMVGSLGTLGILTQVTLMVRPQPEASAFLVCEAATFEIAEKLLAGLVHSPARPVAVEFVAGQQATNDMVLGPMLEGNIGRLYVGFEGDSTEVDWMAEQLRCQWLASGGNAPMLVPSSRTEALWQWFTEFDAEVQIHVLPSDVVETSRRILSLVPTGSIHAHAGNGIIQVSGVGGAIAALRETVNAAGGKMVVRRPLTGLSMSIAEAWGQPGPELRIMQAIKDRFDPKNILNPGRFLFA